MLSMMLVALALAAPAQESYGFVLTQGTDTVGVERVTRDRAGLHSEILDPGRARLSVSAVVDSHGCVREAVTAVFPLGSGPDATPLRRVAVRLDGDSAHVEVRAVGTVRALTRFFPGARFVLAGESVAASALLLECARAAGVDSVDLPAVAFPNLRAQTVKVRWHGDSAMVVASDTSWAHFDHRGRLERMVIGRSGLVARRVTERELDRISFAAPDYSAPPGAPYQAEEVTVPVGPGVALSGTLTLPTSRPARCPAVVTISGSGPQDRDCFAPIAGGWRPFRELADALGRSGIAVLRFDDRGVGRSSGDYASGTERTTADDVRAVLAFLRARSDIDGGRIAVLGHSEGARVAMLVGAEDRELAGLVLLSGAADPRAAIRHQAVWASEHGPLAGRVSRDSIVAMVNRQMDSLATILPREVLRWDAAGLARRVRAPVAIFHGSTDRQVPAEQAEALGGLFRGAGLADVTVRVFPEVNHLLVRDPDGDFLRYDRLGQARVDVGVKDAITGWLVGRLLRTN
jgi:uncharacterized protein